MRNGLPRDEVIRATVVPVSQPSPVLLVIGFTTTGAWALEYGREIPAVSVRAAAHSGLLSHTIMSGSLYPSILPISFSL
jgi:hypothetical protein